MSNDKFGWVRLSQVESGWVWLSQVESGWVCWHIWVESGWVRLSQVESGWVRLSPLAYLVKPDIWLSLVESGPMANLVKSGWAWLCLRGNQTSAINYLQSHSKLLSFLHQHVLIIEWPLKNWISSGKPQPKPVLMKYHFDYLDYAFYHHSEQTKWYCNQIESSQRPWNNHGRRAYLCMLCTIIQKESCTSWTYICH